LGGLLGFGVLLWKNAKTNAFLEQIHHVKELKMIAEKKKKELEAINKK
jgi:hypothetical protein